MISDACLEQINFVILFLLFIFYLGFLLLVITKILSHVFLGSFHIFFSLNKLKNHGSKFQNIKHVSILRTYPA